ncbi:H-type small acid-soluble spore protein [Clostridium aciditolerans]|uniref:Small, acid-soluble spore protein H n=1 Tax=Clostridium aciditolerans TaxID=339861 RepID=A0A934HTZ0_9CLOT|nr:H-type small acid-soluble spore protein [Clostridium aciditolerans]MBI6873258.1 H-type small acid-soluble spore protein [Clostridium aciditolerans]
MNTIRAKEIASSTIMADVTHNGTRIYIESVNDNEGTAKIHPLNNPKSEQEVSLSDLMEH